jgi:crotonobetainyl-CoA:carnitine CoA-transferase CaiB-like acyl-CoA transferase
MIVDQKTADGSHIKVPGIVPKLSATPGRIHHPAPLLGEHTLSVSAMTGWPVRAETEADHV